MGQSIILIMFAIYCLSFLGAVATSHLGMLFMFIVHCSLFIVHCSLFVLLLLLRTLLLRTITYVLFPDGREQKIQAGTDPDSGSVPDPSRIRPGFFGRDPPLIISLPVYGRDPGH